MTPRWLRVLWLALSWLLVACAGTGGNPAAVLTVTPPPALTPPPPTVAPAAIPAMLPTPDPATGLVAEQFDSWRYTAGVAEGAVFVSVAYDVSSARGIAAFDAANRTLATQVQGAVPVHVVFRRPLSADEVAAIVGATGIAVTGYIARAVDDQGLRVTMMGPGMPPGAGGTPMPTVAPTPTRPDRTPAPANPRAGFKGYVTLDATADTGQLAHLLADGRVFTTDVTEAVATARGRAALIVGDPSRAALPVRRAPSSGLYWWLEERGIAPLP